MGINGVKARSLALQGALRELPASAPRGGAQPAANAATTGGAATGLGFMGGDAFEGAPQALQTTPQALQTTPQANPLPTREEVRQNYPGLQFIPKGKTGAGLVNGLITPEQVDWQKGIQLGKIRGKGHVNVSPEDLERASAKLQAKIDSGKVKPGKMPSVALKSVRLSDSKKVNLRLNADGSVGVQSENKPKGGLFKKILGTVAPIAAAFIPVVGPFISAGLSIYNGAKAIKNKDWLGAVTSFAGGIGGGAAALGLSGVAKGANLVAKGAQAVQTGMNAIKARDLPGFLQAGAGFLGTAAGAVGGRFQGWSDNLNRWSERLQQGAQLARLAQNPKAIPQAILGEAIDRVLTPAEERERRAGG
jgi:hypothetical protein